MTETFFFDSYAIIEFLQGNEGYIGYRDKNLITTQLNLYGVYYRFLGINPDLAEAMLKKYEANAVNIDTDTIKKAATLKRQNKRMSMTDTIGYATSLRYKIPFLTGDREFKDMPNVEYVK